MTHDKSAIRQFGVKAVVVRGEVVHPECRTDEEIGVTSVFSKEGNGNCQRCGKTLERKP